MLINNLKAELKAANTRPKAIKVSVGTWKELMDAGLIEYKEVSAWGIIDLGFEMPFYDGDICVIVEPELLIQGIDYELPPCVYN